MKDITNPDFATPEKQEARAFLRERFLRALTSVIGRFLNSLAYSTIIYLTYLHRKIIKLFYNLD